MLPNELEQQLKHLISQGDLVGVEGIASENSWILELEPWLYQAAEAGKLDLVQFFFENGLDKNQRRADGLRENALSAAAARGHVDVVRFLLEKKALSELDTVDANPLLLAVAASSLECVRLLVEAGVDLHKTYYLSVGYRRNALSYAVQLDDDEIAQYLRSQGAKLPIVPELLVIDLHRREQLSERILGFLETKRTRPLDDYAILREDKVVEFWHVEPSNKLLVNTIFTRGLSLATRVEQVSPIQRELMVHLPFSWDIHDSFFQTPQYRWPLERMRQLAEGILDSSISMPEPLMILPNGNPPSPLGEGTQQNSLLLLTDFYRFGPVVIDENLNVLFCLLISLFEQERQYEKKHGILPLLKAMRPFADFMLTNPRREPYVS
ncbi:ankyrin repeat domain-containing protein [Bremerella cremea]|nr:ankyrin repeat domain-containing protein [Bremerella cremea]